MKWAEGKEEAEGRNSRWNWDFRRRREDAPGKAVSPQRMYGSTQLKYNGKPRGCGGRERESHKEKACVFLMVEMQWLWSGISRLRNHHCCSQGNQGLPSCQPHFFSCFPFCSFKTIFKDCIYLFLERREGREKERERSISVWLPLACLFPAAFDMVFPVSQSTKCPQVPWHHLLRKRFLCSSTIPVSRLSPTPSTL